MVEPFEVGDLVSVKETPFNKIYEKVIWEVCSYSKTKVEAEALGFTHFMEGGYFEHTLTHFTEACPSNESFIYCRTLNTFGPQYFLGISFNIKEYIYLPFAHNELTLIRRKKIEFEF